MPNDISCIVESIVNDRFAMRGFDKETLATTNHIIRLVHDVFLSSSEKEDVAVVPTGSRIKGYANNESDLDVMIIAHGDVDVDSLRLEIDDVVFRATGVRTIHDQDGFVEPDKMLTSYIYDSGANPIKSLSRLRAASISIYQGGPGLIGQNLFDINKSLSNDTVDSSEFQGHLAAQYNEMFVNPKEGYKLGERFIGSLLLRGHSLDVEATNEGDYEPSRLSKYFFPEIALVSECFDRDSLDFAHAADVELKAAYDIRLKQFGYDALKLM